MVRHTTAGNRPTSESPPVDESSAQVVGRGFCGVYCRQNIQKVQMQCEGTHWHACALTRTDT